MEDSAIKTPGNEATPNGASTKRPRPALKRLVLALGLAVIVIVGVIYWRSTAWESTDNAQIDGLVFPVSSRVSGHVMRVMVDDNQYVDAGTVLVQLDPKDYEVAVAIAQGQLANDTASATALLTGVPITSTGTASQISTAQAGIDGANAGFAAAGRQFEAAQASLREAKANDLKAQDDVARYKPLAAKDEIPQQQYTTAVSSQQATAAAVEAARASAAAAEEAVTQAGAKIAQAQAELQSARTAPQQVSVQRSRARAAEAEAQRSMAE